MPDRPKLTGSELGKLQLYQQFYSMEFSLLVAYGSVFVTAEGIALALAFFLKQLDKTEQLWILAIMVLPLRLFSYHFCITGLEK